MSGELGLLVLSGSVLSPNLGGKIGILSELRNIR